MFQNSSTLWIEILVLIVTLVFLSTIVGVYLYKKAKGLPTGDCAMCHKSKKQLLKEYHKCCCSKK